MKKGTKIVPFSFYHMATDIVIQQIEQLVDSTLEADPEYFRVNVRIKPTNNVKVFLDGDNGITIEKCVQVNRRLYKLLEEVSSPGVDEPLKMHRQYTKNIGRSVEVIFTDGTKSEGKLVQVAEADMIIEQVTGKGTKAITQQIVIPFNNIKSTTVQIKF